MLRLLKEADRDAVLDYLYQDKHFNIFLIGDIENFGFEKSFQKVYGVFDELGNYLAVFLKYRMSVIYYSKSHYIDKDVISLIKKEKFDFFSGKAEIIELLAPYLEGYKKNEMYFCKAGKMLSNIDYDDRDIKIVETEEECGKLYDLLSTIEEFAIMDQSRKQFIENKMNSLDTGTVLYLEEAGEFVSSVSTTAETTVNAMVVAVATLKDHRNKGYATKLLKALMYYYFKQKEKELCLFYDNPKAGKIYHRLGFETIGNWHMYKKAKKSK